MNTTITLKKLTEKYTVADILQETNKKYTLYAESIFSLVELVTIILNSPDGINNDKDIVLMASFLGRDKNKTTVVYAGFQMDSLQYRFTANNCCNIEEIACCNVHIVDQEMLSKTSSISDCFPKTEIELLIVILLSINAFSEKVVDSYFGGEAKNADSIAYISELIKTTNSR